MKPLGLDRLVAAEVLIITAVVASLTPTQNDTWWHLRTGLETVRLGHVVQSDFYSHTATGAPWLTHSWLTQVLFYELYRLGGPMLLTGFCAVVLTGGWAFVFRLTRGPLLERALLVMAGVAGSSLVWAIRPQVLTLAFVIVEAWLLLGGWPWWVVPLVLLWANLHGGVVLGLVMLLAWGLALAWTEPRRLRTFAPVVLLAVAATILTPLGLSFWPEVARSLDRSRVNEIVEWRRPDLAATFAVFWLTAVTLVGLALARLRRTAGLGDRFLAVASLLYLALAARAQRNIGPFMVVATITISRLIWTKNGPPEPRVTAARSRAHVLVLVASVIAAAAFVVVAWRAPLPRLGWRPIRPEAVTVIRNCPAPIFNRYDDGGVLIWFVPEHRVFLDSRQDPYPVSLVQEATAAERAGDFGPLLARHRIRCAVLPASVDVATLPALGWRESYRDDQWVVFEQPAAPAGRVAGP